MENKNYPLKTALMMTAGMGILYIWARYRGNIINKLRLLTNHPLRSKRIRVVDHFDECGTVVDILKKHCNTCKVLGFDCEWVSVGGKRRPIALLQLSSHEGLCALFRLNCMLQVPQSLRELLEDKNIVKVGVAAHDDAQKLSFDYGVDTVSTFDLRYLSALVGHKPDGIGGLALSLLGVELDKNWRLACSNWEAKELNEKQLNYAANDALVGVEVFKKLAQTFNKRIRWRQNNKELNELLEQLEPYYDIRYKSSFNKLSVTGQTLRSKSSTANSSNPSWRATKTQTRGFVTRAKPLYDNCLLEAPDGELLANINRNKAQWYIDQGLAEEVPSSKGFAVRLNFQPSGRGVGDEGLYYQLEKENRCVVCGRSDVYLRKNIVPREYRKNFPIHIKSHTSHDVLLLCPGCHQRSNLIDLHLRMQLAKRCNAPLSHGETAVKYFEVHELRMVKSAARALLNNYEKIPLARRQELENTIRTHFKLSKNDAVFEVLEEAAGMETQIANNKYVEHGCKVVEMYTNELGGIFELQKLWRENFLHTMKPKYLPSMWNVNHNANKHINM